MAEQTITVARIEFPKPGKKQAAIYDTNDQRWGIFPNDLGAFTQGASYRVWDWQTSMFNGREYRTIKSENYQFVGGGGMGAAQAGGQRQPPNGGRTSAQSAPPRDSGLSSGYDLERRRDIFVCGAINHILGNPGNAGIQDNGQALVQLVWRLRKVWDYGLGPHARDPSFTSGPATDTHEGQAQTAQGYGPADMEDSIPF